MITAKIQEIFQNRFGINLESSAFKEDSTQENTRIRLYDYQWLYLIKDIETIFDIEIDIEAIENGKIRTYKGLVESIEDQIIY